MSSRAAMPVYEDAGPIEVGSVEEDVEWLWGEESNLQPSG
jgi:hypothetical protein